MLLILRLFLDLLEVSGRGFSGRLNDERQCTVRSVSCHEYNSWAAWLHPKCEVSLAHVASPTLDGDASLFNLNLVLLSLNGIFTCRTLCGNTPPPLQEYAFNTEFTVQYARQHHDGDSCGAPTSRPYCFDLPTIAAPRLGESWLHHACPWLGPPRPAYLYVIQIQELEALGLGNPILVTTFVKLAFYLRRANLLTSSASHCTYLMVRTATSFKVASK
jgi:hypothetical protein